MRVLLDTNILARAAAGPPGPAHELFLRLTHHEHVLLISQPLTAELARIMRYERVRKMHGCQIRRLTNTLRALCWSPSELIHRRKHCRW